MRLQLRFLGGTVVADVMASQHRVGPTAGPQRSSTSSAASGGRDRPPAEMTDEAKPTGGLTGRAGRR